MKGDAKKAREAGCNDYMSKPINIMDLLEKVEKLIANKI
jgi:CheY-like chemotaxis protein